VPGIARALLKLANPHVATDRPQVTLVGSKIPAAIPKPVVGPGIYILLVFVLPMAPVVGPFCPLLLSVIMGAFGASQIIEVTRSNAAAPSAPSKAEPAKDSTADGDAKKD
jgi:hypothetical protein